MGRGERPKARSPSVPVRLFIHLFSINNKFYSFTSPSLPCAGSRVFAYPNMLFMVALPIPPLPPHSALLSLQFVLFSHHSRTDRPSSQHSYRDFKWYLYIFSTGSLNSYSIILDTINIRCCIYL